MIDNLDEEIFKYINPNDNDELSKLNGYDLQDLIILINDFYIRLRNKLGLEEYVTFGLELEFENANIYKIDKELLNEFPNFDWTTHKDATLDSGGEISSPILKDTIENWRDLDKVCNIVKPLASIGKHSGGHIHIGTQVLGNKRDSWLNFIKLWSIYENIIFRFSYGNFLTGRQSLYKYAKPLSKTFGKVYENSKERNYTTGSIIAEINHTRYQAVNLDHVINYDEFKKRNTIEFRCPNGSLDAAIWQNNVNLFVKLLEYSKNKNFNNDIIDKRHKLYLNKYYNLNLYNEIFLEQALELADLIFNNNYDKVYFLKQYLKSFQIYDSKNHNQTCVLTKKK